MWARQVPELSKHFRVLRYDTRGHGKSSIPDGEYRFEHLAGDVAELLDSLGITRAHFCGLSMGGPTGIALALAHPERVDSLILCNTAARIGSAEGWTTRINAVAEQTLEKMAPALVERWLTDGYRAAEPGLSQVLVDMLRRIGRRLLAQLRRAARRRLPRPRRRHPRAHAGHLQHPRPGRHAGPGPSWRRHPRRALRRAGHVTHLQLGTARGIQPRRARLPAGPVNPGGHRMQRWKHRPEGSNWGDFGPDDQLGRLNLITEEQVLKGAREIRAGKTFCLSLPLDLPGGNVLNPRRHPPQLSPTRLRDTPYLNFPLRNVNPDALDVLSDDQVLLSMQYSTQWDALAHVGALFDADGDGVPELRYYNGYAAGVDVIGRPTAATRAAAATAAARRRR